MDAFIFSKGGSHGAMIGSKCVPIGLSINKLKIVRLQPNPIAIGQLSIYSGTQPNVNKATGIGSQGVRRICIRLLR